MGHHVAVVRRFRAKARGDAAKSKRWKKGRTPDQSSCPAVLITRSYRRSHALSCTRCRMVLCVWDWTNCRAQGDILACQKREVRQDDATIADRTCSSEFVRNARACRRNRAISGQVADGPCGRPGHHYSYTNVSALREQLREAAEAIAAFIVRHAGCNPDAELTRRLQKQATAIEVEQSEPGLRCAGQIAISTST